MDSWAKTGAAFAVGGPILGGPAASYFSKSDEAERKAAALERYRARRRALAQALSDNYWSQGQAEQEGLSNQMRSLGDGTALAQVYQDIPDATMATTANTAGMDPAQAAAYARRAGIEAGLTNANLATNTAARRRARFAKLLDNQAWQANAPVRFRSPEFRRSRFQNALDAAQADADFERDFGDTPNSTRNLAFLGDLSGIANQIGIRAATMGAV